MRATWIALATSLACRGAPDTSRAPDDAAALRAAPPDDAAIPHRRVADLAAWLRAVADADRPRVLLFGELHARSDRPVARSALARFSDQLLPAIGDRVSDLVVETWVIDPRCGAAAAQTSRRIDAEMRRPPATQSEVAALASRARQAGIQPHALRLGCDDYAAIAPKGGDLAVETLLDVVTRELGRVTTSAIAHRDQQAGARPLVAVYGGALHNDLAPFASVAAWSIGPRLDALTHQRAVEIDLYVPEYAEVDALARTEPWFPLVAEVGAEALVIERGPRSYLVLLPRAAP